MDRQSRELRKHGLKVKLQEQPFRVLELLLERPGDLISREQFQRQIWPADSFVDFELGLNTAVKRLRQALGDSADTPRFIETLPRRGYRFVFPVDGVSAVGGDSAGSATATPQPGVGPQIPRPLSMAVAATRTRKKGIWAALVLFLAAALVGGLYLLAGHSRTTGSAAQIRSVAVLPLENLSSDPEQEYFADGMTDEIITDLAKMGGLRVISRTSVLRFKHSREALPQIARELNVDAVVEGTVRRSSHRVRITAQLIRAYNDQHLWADEFEGDLQDVLTLQDDVARAIVGKIHGQLAGRQQIRVAAARQVDPEAYDFYLRGQHILAQQGTREALNNAIRDYMLALEKDSNYAPAYAALAHCYSQGMFVGRPLPPREAWARASEAARKALQIDDELAEAHIAMGAVRFRYDWNWAEADREYKRAIELNPNSAHAYADYSIFLNIMRRTDEGTAAALQAQQLDPLSASVSNAVALSYSWAHRYDEAIRQEKKILQLESDFAPAHGELARNYEAEGRWDDAVSEWLIAFARDGMDAETVRAFQEAYHSEGIKAFWRKWLERDDAKVRRGDRPRFMEIARLCFLLGDKTASFGWLEKAYQQRDPGLPNMYSAATWLDASRSDPRYMALARRIGLPQ